jgi:predicted phosphodiesterase
VTVQVTRNRSSAAPYAHGQLITMRLAIVSGIHGNLTAAEAVIADLSRRGVDRVVHGGDQALAGCRPAEVVDRVRELGWPGIVGNTDELLWRSEQHETQLRNAAKLHAVLRLLFDENAPGRREMLGDEGLGWLRQLPPEHRERDLVLVHASPGDLWRAPLSDADDTTLGGTYGSCNARTVVYGHIHRPYVRRPDRITIANIGSVGSPFDGDLGASYLLLDADEAQLIRVDYDIEREIDLLRDPAARTALVSTTCGGSGDSFRSPTEQARPTRASLESPPLAKSESDAMVRRASRPATVRPVCWVGTRGLAL